VSLIDDASRLAESLVAPLGRRWLHVQAVARRADVLSVTVDAADRDSLVAAAWLHDIGYAPEVDRTGFHPLDGARYLRDAGWPDVIVNLVAHHSGARHEAAGRGLSDQLGVFPFEESAMSDALAAADLTTGPAGERLTYDERVDEILSRYPASHVVHRTWVKIRPTMATVVARAEERRAESQSTTG
jgi:hypothetical protein